MEGGAVRHNFERDPPKDHPCQVWFNLVQRFQRRRFKCDLLSKYQITLNLAGMVLGWVPFQIVSDSPALHARWLLLLKIEISSIVHCCFSISQNWFRGFRGKDLNVIFYQNMPILHNRYKSADRKISQKNAEYMLNYSSPCSWWLLLLKIEISSIVHCFMFDTMLTFGRFAIYLRTMLTYLNMYDQLLVFLQLHSKPKWKQRIISIQRETTQLILENLGMREFFFFKFTIFFIEIAKPLIEG
jgi:hypothetical protein